MAWEIVSKETISRNIRIPVNDIQDMWYDAALGLIESFSGLHLTEAASYTEVGDGNGSEFFAPLIKPINSVSSLYISEVLIPSNLYVVRWNGIWFKTPAPLSTNPYTTSLLYYDKFEYGIGNVQVTYNGGGITNLPTKYLDSLPMTITLVVQVLSTLNRIEGTDQVLEKYRPDRSKVKEEVLANYGIHGKVKGIIKSWLPNKVMVA